MNRNSKSVSCNQRRKMNRVIRTITILLLTIITLAAFRELQNDRRIMNEMKNPIIMGFPLRGEWLSPNTPGTKIPSHGTNQLGTRYAYDFIQVDWKRFGLPAYRGSLAQWNCQ